MRGRVLGAVTTATILTMGMASAGHAAVDRRTQASGASPFPPVCNTQPQNGPLFLNSEVEPWIDVDPTSAGDADGPNLIGVYQQDRYGTGGARGLGTSVSPNGGQSYVPLTAAQLPKFSQCAGNPLYERASDPWVSFSPAGTAHQISLSFNDTANLDNAVLVSRSTKAQGGTTWSAPITLKRDTNPTVFNDKESITADQNVGANGQHYVYAIWDRLVFPNERSRGQSFLTAAAFRGPAWFARSTNDGASWEPAHPIYDPGQNDQTIGNQIVALGNTDLVDVMTVFKSDNNGGNRGGRIAVLRSTNRGSSWTGPITISRLGTVGVTDPDTGDPIRTGDIIPEIASDERSGNDDVYAVWQDARFNGFQRDQVAFSRSTDGGLTWSTPVRISRHNETQAFTPAIRVDGNGNVGVTYYDFRNNDPATPALETDTWFTRSTDGGRTWSEERVTPTSFDMRTAPVARGFFTGDYEGLTALGGSFWSLVSESRGSTDTWSARLTSPFAGPSYTPSGNENNSPSAKAFPVAKGRPAPA
jgi:hypothetical protein